MAFTLTKSKGKLALASLDGSALVPKADELNKELNKVCERIEQEKEFIGSAESEINNIAEQVKTDTLTIEDGLKRAIAVEQNLETDGKIKAFTVFAVDDQGKPNKRPDPSVKVCDILIRVEDLPVSEEQTDFKVEIDRTLTVINQVLRPEEKRSKWLLDLNRDKRTRYLRGLKGICHIGLEHEQPSQLTLAKKSLESFREEFVTNEAGTVKNKYLWRLGWRCLVMSAIASLAYVFVRSLDTTHPLHYFRNFLILVAGAGVGTWLSIALRRVIVTFLDLAALEEDRLDPTIRVLFVTALTCIVGLLIWTGAVSLGIGQFTTTQFPVSGPTALLIGLLLGIAERTMATAVQTRATEFGAGIGGK
jgi:hypothetical protein